MTEFKSAKDALPQIGPSDEGIADLLLLIDLGKAI
jgi:hypothetical protein